MLGRLLGHISTEHLYFWIKGLRDFTLAASHLSGSGPDGTTSASLMERLVLAGKLYLQGLSSVVALRQVADALSKLGQSAFDADQDSLTN